MTVQERLVRAKKYLVIAESKDAKSQAFKLAAKEIAAYRAETGATYTAIAEDLGREKAGGTWVRTLVKWHEDGYPTPTPWAIPSENDRVRLVHGKRALREATPEQVEKMMEDLPASQAAHVVQAALGRPGVTRELAKSAEGSATVTRASGKIREEAEFQARARQSRHGAAETLGVITETLGSLLDAKRKLRDSYAAARDSDLTEDQREAIRENLDEVATIIDWYRSYLDSGDQSFEDELSKLLSS